MVGRYGIKSTRYTREIYEQYRTHKTCVLVKHIRVLP